MIKFDRLKIVAPLESLTILNKKVFESISKGGAICSLRYRQEYPFLLTIKVDYDEKEVVIEFSGKVLKRDYPDLISANTIKKCFENIEALGFCEIDFEAMMDADVVSCDVTRDVKCSDFAMLTSYLKTHISNYQTFLAKLLPTKNLSIEKNVLTRKCKKRMIIYNKEREMASSLNKQFVDDYGLSGKFNGEARFELNLNSKQQIRDALNISDTKLRNVLNSSASPIASFVDAAIDTDINEANIGNWCQYKIMCVLKANDFDLEKVEANVRSLCKRGTKISEVMKPYREAMEQIQVSPENNQVKDVLEQLR